MNVLNEKSVVISLDEARDYSKSKLTILSQEKDRLLNELDKIDISIDMEMEKLIAIENDIKKRTTFNERPKVVISVEEYLFND